MNTENELNRRQFLTVAVVAALGMVRPAAGAGCPVTEDNPPGPFYLPGAPFRSKLAPDSQPGERLVISGRVLAAPGCAPLAGAVVDVWHASTAGFYYGLEASRPLKPEEYLLRGRIRTGEDGRYSFDTILPGKYQVNENWVRPRHIHYIVSHPTRQSLTTQLYFEGDPHNLTDPMVKSPLIIPLKRLQGKGSAAAYEGTFDIVLSSG
jgi:protocatechuate 3,4-dioxygenase beta subunit